MNRRDFIRATAGCAVATSVPVSLGSMKVHNNGEQLSAIAQWDPDFTSVTLFKFNRRTKDWEEVDAKRFSDGVTSW